MPRAPGDRYGGAVRFLVQLLYLVRRFLLRLFRVRTRGVKVMLFNGRGEVLLIRNAYGNRSLFVFPGGGIHRREAPEAAAARELREETGLAAAGLRLRSTHVSRAEGKRDTVFLFSGTADGEPQVDRVEVEEALFFALEELPENLSSSVARRLGELRTGSPPDPNW